MKVFICEDKTELTNIKFISPIVRMIDMIPSTSIELHDFEGGLYDAFVDASESVKYSELQFEPIWITNDAETIYFFIGRINNIEFMEKSAMLSCEGTSAKLNDKPFSKNYILADGFVKTVGFGGDDAVLELETDADPPDAFTWANDIWHSDKNTGILLTDTTGSDALIQWVATARTLTAIQKCTIAELYTFAETNNPSTESTDYHRVTISGNDYLTQNMIGACEYTMSGASFGTVNSLSKLEIKIDARTLAVGTATNCLLTLQILKETEWIDLITIGLTRQEQTITIDEIPSELIKYLTIDGANYVNLKLRSYITAIDNADDPPFDACITFMYYLEAFLYVDTASFNPIQFPITDNGATTLTSSGINFSTNGIVVGDRFQIGENTTKVLTEAFGFIGLENEIDNNFDKYISRNIKTILPMAILQDICTIENAHWFETYDSIGNVVIKIYREENFISSGVTLTEASYRRDFRIERSANSYSKVVVYGNPYFNIIATAVSTTSNSPLEFTIINPSINTQTDAQYVDNGKLEYLENIRPSIVLDTYGDFYDLQCGELISATLSRPSVTITELPIRRIDIQQDQFADDVKMRLYIGMGHSPPEETLGRSIKKSLELGWKSQTDLLSNPVVAGTQIFSHSSLTNLSNDDHTQYLNNTRGDARYTLDTNTVKLSGNQNISDVKTFTSFPITPSSAPTLDYQVANKKYVDESGGGGASLDFDPLNLDNLTYQGITLDLIAGETLSAKDFVYQKSDGKVWKAKADAIATANCIGVIVIGGSADDTVSVLIYGVLRNDSFSSFTVGGTIYLSSSTAGEHQNTTVVSANNHCVCILGIGLASKILFVNPNNMIVELIV